MYVACDFLSAGDVTHCEDYDCVINEITWFLSFGSQSNQTVWSKTVLHSVSIRFHSIRICFPFHMLNYIFDLNDLLLFKMGCVFLHRVRNEIDLICSFDTSTHIYVRTINWMKKWNEQHEIQFNAPHANTHNFDMLNLPFLLGSFQFKLNWAEKNVNKWN